MTKNNFDENLEITNKDIQGSIACQAVAFTMLDVVQKVAKKHKLRGDSWFRTTSATSMFQLSHNKMHRVEIIFKQPLTEELKKEIEDELQDIIAYSSFILHILPNIKSVLECGADTE